MGDEKDATLSAQDVLNRAFDKDTNVLKTSPGGPIPAGDNLIGDVGIAARSSGGAQPYRNLGVLATPYAVNISPGQIYMLHAINLTAAPIFLRVWNAITSTVTIGTLPHADYVFPVPANADSDGAGFIANITQGLEFSNAITIAATTGIADTDVANPAANALVVNMGIK